MQWLEILGTILAASGFTMLSLGYLKNGFITGLLSCLLLIPFFYYNDLFYLLTLQAYFAIFNIIGIRRN